MPSIEIPSKSHVPTAHHDTQRGLYIALVAAAAIVFLVLVGYVMQKRITKRNKMMLEWRRAQRRAVASQMKYSTSTRSV